MRDEPVRDRSRPSPRIEAHRNKCAAGRAAAAVFALLALFLSGGQCFAASGSYDEHDPFDETDRVERLKRLGWDFSKEIEIELRFSFADRSETRERYARTFASKLRRMGYPEASAHACAGSSGCWFVLAPTKLRIDLAKQIDSSKELDQLAADYYGRYDGWDCELFRQEDEHMRSAWLARQSVPTAEVFLEQLTAAFAMQCLRISENVERSAKTAEAAGKGYEAYLLRNAQDMMCQCAPERARQVRVTLLPAEKEARITEADFMQTYALPKIMQPCVAEMVRKTYSEGCPQFAESLRTQGKSYCSCVRSIIDQLSEAELMQVGLESADYLPIAAQAQKEGRAPPTAPPTYAKFAEKEAACRK